MSHDDPIEKIHINTGFKLSFTSPSIKDLVLSLEGMVMTLPWCLGPASLNSTDPNRK